MSMLWQRFTERAKRVVIAAQEVAAQAGEPHVNPEHLLLGLMKESDSVATKVLERLSVSSVRVRQEIERQSGKRSQAPLNNNDVTLDPRMKHVLDFAYQEARSSNTNYIGTEHLLLGILREGDGIVYRTLTKLGVDIVSSRKEVVSYLGGPPEPNIADDVSGVLQPGVRRGGLYYMVRRFTDPQAAEEFLNTWGRFGARVKHATASNGELWLVVDTLLDASAGATGAAAATAVDPGAGAQGTAAGADAQTGVRPAAGIRSDDAGGDSPAARGEAG